MDLQAWAIKWGVPAGAMQELHNELGALSEPNSLHHGKSESAVQAHVRIAASKLGWRLFRNNVGVLMDKNGRPVRYGLANESKGMNLELKSSDLIGIRPILIGPQHVGHVIGQFIGREVKHGDWKYGEDPEREGPQENWAVLVNSLGGDAKFTTGNL